MTKLTTQAAASIAEEERSWRCESCETYIEPHITGPHCRYCAMYWDDVANGLFEVYDG